MITTATVGTWRNESHEIVASGVDAFGLAEKFGGVVARLHKDSVRLGLRCGPDCLKREGCWAYRSFYLD